MTNEELYRKRLIGGFRKSPELLSWYAHRVFTHIGTPEHLFYVEEFVNIVNSLMQENVYELCEDISKAIVRNIKDVTTDDNNTGEGQVQR